MTKIRPTKAGSLKRGKNEEPKSQLHFHLAMKPYIPAIFRLIARHICMNACMHVGMHRVLAARNVCKLDQERPRGGMSHPGSLVFLFRMPRYVRVLHT